MSPPYFYRGVRRDLLDALRATDIRDPAEVTAVLTLANEMLANFPPESTNGGPEWAHLRVVGDIGVAMDLKLEALDCDAPTAMLVIIDDIVDGARHELAALNVARCPAQPTPPEPKPLPVWRPVAPVSLDPDAALDALIAQGIAAVPKHG